MNKQKNIRVFLVDDEPQAHDLLKTYIERIPYLELAGAASNGPMALSMSSQIQPDLLLLDINMPKMSGFELLSEWPKPVPLVIITSGYREYALKGYEHAVVDFLEKPIFFDRFTQAIHRVEVRHELFIRAQSHLSLASVSYEKPKPTLIVRSNRADVIIPYDSINYIESLENYLKIHTLDMADKTVLTKMTLTECEQQLPTDQFIRISRKHIVNVEKIHQVAPASIKLFSGESLNLGTTFRDQVQHSLEAMKNKKWLF